jgi:FtsX-like permease family
LTASVVREASYRFRACFHERWSGYLVLVLLIALLGGVAMAAVAGARRTQSSFPAYLASTNPGDVLVFSEFDPISGTGYSPRLDRAIARVRYVKRAVDVIGFDGTLQPLGPARGSGVPGEAPPSVEGSPNGEYFTQDRVTLVRGRMADPARSDEVMMSAGGAAELGLRPGSAERVAFFTTAQVNSPSFRGYPADRPYLVIALKLVGIIENSDQVVQDDDAALGNQLAVLTPALTRRLESCCAYYSYVSLQLDGGARHEAAVLGAVRKITPDLGQAGGSQTNAPLVAKAERTIRPESIAFGVFGLIAALAALVICGQVAGRLVRRNAEDGPVLRALGAGPAMTVCDGLIGVLGAVVAGSALAVAVAVTLSPLAPVGPVRPVYPDRGVAFDWTVLGLGFVLLVLVLSGSAVAVAYRILPHRAARARGDVERGSVLVRTAAARGLPPTAVAGIRWALAPGRGAAPVRSALLGAVIAVVVVAASITFGSSLSSLVSRPALYGWNWDYALLAGFSAAENLPAAQTAALLDHDPVVARWSGVYFAHMQLDGQAVPVLATSPNAAIGPPLLSGHGLQAASQVVLGPATLAQLHKHVGDTVVASTGAGPPFRLRIVGTATLPTIGSSGSPSLQMGTGAIVAAARFPAQALNPQGTPVAGPMAVFITIRPGVTPAAARRSLDQVTSVLNRPSDPDGPVGGAVSVLRPAEIANYRTVGSTPAALAAILAAGAVGALGLTLIASVRRRRREFALLKTLGFTQRQLAATVAWQSSVPAVVGVIFGIPLGIALGRWLWILFARGISAVPDPTVPALSLVVVAVGAIVFANLVAVFPGRVAARTPTALLLRTE